MKNEYIFALVYPKERTLTTEQIQALRSEAHASADHSLDSLCARALDGHADALKELNATIRDQLREVR